MNLHQLAELYMLMLNTTNGSELVSVFHDPTDDPERRIMVLIEDGTEETLYFSEDDDINLIDDGRVEVADSDGEKRTFSAYTRVTDWALEDLS